MSPRGNSIEDINSVFKSPSNNCCSEVIGILFESCRFQLLVDSFGEPKLERLNKTVTKCNSEFEWVVCVVNDVLRRSVKIHMDIPLDFFFSSQSLWSWCDSHRPLCFSFTGSRLTQWDLMIRKRGQPNVEIRYGDLLLNSMASTAWHQWEELQKLWANSRLNISRQIFFLLQDKRQNNTINTGQDN